jgi:NADPH:quinone reductase-like Zn-dependent oxidoreductase
MTRRRKVLVVLLAVVAVALMGSAAVISHDAPCVRRDAPAATGASQMKAIVYRCYGSPDVLALEDVDRPAVADDEVLVRVRAASANPLDWHYMRGTPYIMRLDAGVGAPKVARLGVDFAGTVEAVGRSVKRFRPGDEVFGARNGAFAEYVAVREDRSLVAKPANVTFEHAASVPVAAVTALQALRDKGNIQAGQKVLINGASGGVGTFAVQIAKSFGAEVTGVCSTRNLELVRSIGADRVIDYTREDFTTSGERYDLILDMVGNHSLMRLRRVMAPDGTLVIVGGKEGKWISPMDRPIKAFLLSPFVSQEMVMILAQLNQADLAFLANLMQSGKLTPVIDRRYALSETAEAIRYLEDGHARGKVLVVPDDGEPS